MKIYGRFYSGKIPHENSWEILYLSKKTPDYKMTHQLFTLFWIISNILTFHFYTFSVIYTFYFYIAFEHLTFYQKCSIKCVLYSLFYIRVVSKKWDSHSKFGISNSPSVAEYSDSNPSIRIRIVQNLIQRRNFFRGGPVQGVTVIVGLSLKLTSFWIIPSQILHFLSAWLAGWNN